MMCSFHPGGRLGCDGLRLSDSPSSFFVHCMWQFNLFYVVYHFLSIFSSERMFLKSLKPLPWYDELSCEDRIVHCASVIT
jgi:hypothetical protein